MKKRVIRIFGVLTLGSLSPKIVMFLLWIFQLNWIPVKQELWFTLSEALFNPGVQIATGFTTILALVGVVIAVSNRDL